MASPKRRTSQQSAKPVYLHNMLMQTVHNIANKHLDSGASELRRVLSRRIVRSVLENGDVDERDTMCNLIGEFRLGEYSDLLVDVLKNDDSPCVRHDAAFALGRVGDPRRAPVLKRAALKDRSVLVRHEATLALAEFGGVENILLRAERDRNEDVAETAGVALAHFRKLQMAATTKGGSRKHGGSDQKKA